MAMLRERLEQLKAAWSRMSGTGRLSMLLIGLLIVAMILLVTQEAGSRDMQPLPTRFAATEITKSAAALQAAGIDCEIRGDQIYVAPGKIEGSISVLASNDALSAEFEIDFEQLFTASSLWQSDTDRERRLQQFITRKLEGCISQMQAVRRASVTINFGSKHTLSSVPKGASASVSVQTARNRPLEKATALAIADLLAGAINGLDRKEVKIIDVTNAVSFNLADDSLASGDYIQKLREYEEHFNRNLRELFPYVPGLFVKARVIPNIHSSTIRTRTVDPRAVIPGTMNESSSVLAGGAASGETGVTPNVGTDPNTGSAVAHSNTTSEETISSPIDYGVKEEMTTRVPGEVAEIGAAINIPRSYFVGVAKMQAGGDEKAEIDESKLAAVTEEEKLRIHKLAVGILKPADPNSIVVESYPDFASEGIGGGAGGDVLEAGGSGMDIMAMAREAAPPVGLALLALAALWVLLNLVRRVQPVALPSEAAFAGDGISEAGLTLDSILEGVELEADTIRASKMQEQISSMIKEDPDAMANLVKRWISQE